MIISKNFIIGVSPVVTIETNRWTIMVVNLKAFLIFLALLGEFKRIFSLLWFYWKSHSPVGTNAATTPCKLRETPEGGVCVCDAEYCDYLDDPTPTSDVQYSLVSSSKVC